MSRKSRSKGARGEREFADISGGVRTWWTSNEHHPDDEHDVFAHGRPWEVKLLKEGFAQAYKALEEFEAHETGDYRPIVAARMDRKRWIVVMYYCCWEVEHGKAQSCEHSPRMDT